MPLMKRFGLLVCIKRYICQICVFLLVLFWSRFVPSTSTITPFLPTQAATEELQKLQQEMGLHAGVASPSLPAGQVLVSFTWSYFWLGSIWFFSNVLLAGGLVHEQLSAGAFIPGHASHPIEKLPERDLRLLRTREDIVPPEAPETPKGTSQYVPPQSGIMNTYPEASPGSTVPDHVEGTPNPKEAMDPPPPPVPKTVVPPKASTKYDKYKDGSYWKILSCMIYVLKFSVMIVNAFWVVYDLALATFLNVDQFFDLRMKRYFDPSNSECSKEALEMYRDPKKRNKVAESSNDIQLMDLSHINVAVYP